MLSNPPLEVTVDEARITVSLDRSQIEIDELLKFLDYLRIQAFLRRNTLDETEIATLAAEIKRKTWQRIKRQLIAAGKGDLLRHIRIYQEVLISTSCWEQAFQLCHSLDPADTPHVALTLELNGLLWTGDRRLKAGLQAKGFTRFFVPHSAQSPEL